LNDIINQIIQIDSSAYENKNSNEDFLLKKKEEYESILLSYKNEKLEEAKQKAQKYANEAEEFVVQTEKAEKEKIIQMSAVIEKNYQKSEESLIQEIFNKLFVLEG